MPAYLKLFCLTGAGLWIGNGARFVERPPAEALQAFHPHALAASAKNFAIMSAKRPQDPVQKMHGAHSVRVSVGTGDCECIQRGTGDPPGEDAKCPTSYGPFSVQSEKDHSGHQLGTKSCFGCYDLAARSGWPWYRKQDRPRATPQWTHKTVGYLRAPLYSEHVAGHPSSSFTRIIDN